MRKILFRGKRTDNGKWVIGMLCQYHEGVKAIIADNHFGTFEGTSEVYVVIPETVTQCIGKFDKNKIEIFEGDIVVFERFKDFYVGKVVFNRITCGFEIWYDTTVGAYGEKATHKINFSNISDIEVIGNIFNHPELLEGDWVNNHDMPLGFDFREDFSKWFK